jgi:PAS domain-containing protein
MLVEMSEGYLQTALHALAREEVDLGEILDALPAPIYVTDAEGLVVRFNSACVGFTGRMPQVGKDRWCVTWKLRTNTGEFLPHDQCPMAQAIREGKPIRGVSAVAERPDGTSVKFMPLPTPLLDDEGRVVGAVNLLIDVTEPRQVTDLRDQAYRCRRLARSVLDDFARRNLESMAADYEMLALGLTRANDDKD